VPNQKKGENFSACNREKEMNAKYAWDLHFSLRSAKLEGFGREIERPKVDDTTHTPYRSFTQNSAGASLRRSKNKISLGFYTQRMQSEPADIRDLVKNSQ